MTARGDLKSPGEILQQARKARGLSLEEMSERTKIPSRLLAAIELDDYQKVAEPLYVKSFLRTYARCLELDTQEILDLYNRGAGTFTPNSLAGQVWEEEVQVRRVGLGQGGMLLRWAGIAAILVVLAVLIGRGLWSQGKPEPQETPGMLAVKEAETAQGDVLTDPVAEPSASGQSAEGSGGISAPGNFLPDAAPQVALDEISPPQGTLAEKAQAEIPSESQSMWRAILQVDSLARLWDAVPPDSPGTPAGTMSRARPLNLPSALRGDANLIFAGGRQWPLVLRILTTELVAISVKADGQARLVPVRWPPGETESMPARNIEPGRVYAVAQGYAMYWGARDHFYVLLSSRDAVQVSLNGINQPVPERNVGREWMLDTDAIGGRNPE